MGQSKQRTLKKHSEINETKTHKSQTYDVAQVAHFKREYAYVKGKITQVLKNTSQFHLNSGDSCATQWI